MDINFAFIQKTLSHSIYFVNLKIHPYSVSKLFLVPLKWLSHSMWNILRLEEQPRSTTCFSETFEEWDELRQAKIETLPSSSYARNRTCK